MWRGAALSCMLGIDRGNSMLGRGHRDHPGSGHGLLTALWPHCTAAGGHLGMAGGVWTVVEVARAGCRLETVPVCQQPGPGQRWRLQPALRPPLPPLLATTRAAPPAAATLATQHVHTTTSRMNLHPPAHRVTGPPPSPSHHQQPWTAALQSTRRGCSAAYNVIHCNSKNI